MKLRMLRGLAGATSLALLATALLSTGAMAASNRDAYFGTPEDLGGTGGSVNANGLVYGTLFGETKVTEGGRTAVTVLLKNEDNQTLNHVKFAGGTTADAKPDNGLFLTPSGTSLPGTASIAAVFPTLSSTTCTATPATGFECNVGQLAAGAFETFTVVINAPPTKGDYPYWLTGSWNEGWSSTGTNADYNFATGTLKVLESNCGNGQATWVLGTELVNLGDGGATCNNQDAGIKSGALGGNGGFASVAVDSNFAVTCPAGYKCFGNTVSVSVADGNPVAGGVEWTVTWFGTKTIKGVIHFADNYATTGAFTAIAFNNLNKCSATKLTDCWKSPLTTTNKPASVTAIYVTGSNGKAGGFN